MYTITKEFHFSAGHQLDQLPSEHPCSRPHGHNYVAVIELQAEQLNQYGFVVDYNDLGVIADFIKDELDHRSLNDAMESPPTAENIAKLLYTVAAIHFPDELVAVTIHETPKTSARYQP